MEMSIDLSSVSDLHCSSMELDDSRVEAGAIEKTIFGRVKETETLFDAYQCLLKTKQPQTVIVHGKSGSGKTALVDTLLSPVFNANGYFISGKYFQNEAVQEPFSAIMAAFSDLCDLVVQSHDFDEIKQQQIAQALDTHVRLLVKVITNFTSLTGVIDEDEVETSSIAKFKSACKAFLCTLASDDHPIVIFLDDVQWADEGSIALIQTLLQDASLFNVMFILAYRDEESEYIEDILDHARHPIDIALSNLDADAVLCMVTSIMGATTNEIRLLSDLVINRTSGNPFHVAMFLDTIEHEGLMLYDDVTESWLFDVDEIREAIMVSETLADLLTRKIDRIPNDIKETLKVASLLGYHFEESILVCLVDMVLRGNKELVSQNTNQARSDSGMPPSSLVIASLSEAVKEGFVERTSDGYQFTHDKLQSAFQGLIGDAEENELHQLIGEVFLKERRKERSYIYKAAVHLNVVPTMSPGHRDRARLARINLDAAHYCVEISAFDRATTALEYGLECLGSEERWFEEYSQLTFEIMEALAKNQFIVGEFEACKETTREALRRSMTNETKIHFQLIDVEVRMAENEIEESLIASYEAMTTLGIKMPRKATTRHVLAKLLKVKWMLKNKTDEDILNLPMANDLLVNQSVKLLVNTCSNYLLKEERETAILSALVATELTLKKGLSPHSPGAFAFYGIAELVIGNWDRSYRFGKLALAMLDRMDSREAQCSTVGFAMTTLAFRRDPFQDLFEPLRLAAKSGFRYGDIGYATYCTVQCHGIGIHLGNNLAILEESMRESYATISELGQDGLLSWLQPTIQYVLNMQADITSCESISVLSGEIMNENQFLERALERNDTVLVMITYLRKARIACDFGQFQLAKSYFDTLTRNFGKDVLKFSYGGPPYYWDVSRAYFNLYRVSGKRHHLKEARKYMKLLRKLANYGCPDASDRLAFLMVAETSIRAKPIDKSTLRATYQQTLNLLAQSKNMVLEALLNEDAGFDFARRGFQAEAKVYFDRALYIYVQEWGAKAKYNQLHQAVQSLIKSESAEAHPAEETLLAGICIHVSSS